MKTKLSNTIQTDGQIILEKFESLKLRLADVECCLPDPDMLITIAEDHESDPTDNRPLFDLLVQIQYLVICQARLNVLRQEFDALRPTLAKIMNNPIEPNHISVKVATDGALVQICEIDTQIETQLAQIRTLVNLASTDDKTKSSLYWANRNDSLTDFAKSLGLLP